MTDNNIWKITEIEKPMYRNDGATAGNLLARNMEIPNHPQ